MMVQLAFASDDRYHDAMVDDVLFPESEAEQRESTRLRLERAALELHERRMIAQRVRTGDLAIAERIRALGFDGETARVFDLIPMIHVAWADGTIQKGERETMLRLLGAGGMSPGSDAFVMVSTLLEKPPPDAFLVETLAIMRELVHADARRSEAIVDLCVAIAEAAGGFLGLGNPVSKEERQVLDRIADALGERAKTWLKAKMGEMNNP